MAEHHQKEIMKQQQEIMLAQKDLDYIKLAIADLKQLIVQMQQQNSDNMKKFVTQDQFKPVKTVVYGLVTLILSAVVMAILADIIKQS